MVSGRKGSAAMGRGWDLSLGPLRSAQLKKPDAPSVPLAINFLKATALISVLKIRTWGFLRDLG